MISRLGQSGVWSVHPERMIDAAVETDQEEAEGARAAPSWGDFMNIRLLSHS